MRKVLILVLFCLICESSFAQIASAGSVANVIPSTLGATQDSQTIKAEEVTGSNLQIVDDRIVLEYPKQYDVSREPAYIRNIGTRIMITFLVWCWFIFVICSYIAYKVDKHMPKMYSDQFSRGPFNKLEKYIVPIGLIAIIAILHGVYWTKLFPRSSGEDRWLPVYRLIGIATVIIVTISLIAAIILFFRKKGDRVAAFLLGTLLCLGFIFLLTFQVVGAAMVGEWSATESAADPSVSTSMDYIPGQIIAAFGLSVVGSGLPILEILHTTETVKGPESEHYLKGLQFGRVARILSAALADMGLTWVVLSPMMNSKNMRFVGEDQLTTWAGFHYLAAAVAFGSLLLYIIFVTLDNRKTLGPKMKLTHWSGLILGVLAMIGLIGTLYLSMIKKIKDPRVDLAFAGSEFAMILAMFPTIVSRYTPVDMNALTKALVIWGKHIELEKEEEKQHDA